MSAVRLPRALAARLSAFACAGALGGVALAALPPEPARMPRAVVVANDAFLLGPPALLAAPLVREVHPSPDGPFVLIVREPAVERVDPSAGLPPGGEAQLLLWNRASGRVSVQWTGPFAGRTVSGVSQVEWLPGTSAALVIVGTATLGEQPEATNSGRRLLLVDTRQARPRDLGPVGDADVLVTGPAPFAALYSHAPLSPAHPEPSGQSLRVVRANGNVGGPLAVPDGVAVLTFYGLDPEAGVVVSRADGRDPQTGRRKVVYYTLSLGNGAMKPLAGRPQVRPVGSGATVAEKIAALPVRLVTRGAVLRAAPSGEAGAPPEERLNAAYLESTGKETQAGRDSRALVAADADAVTLTPDGAAALYRTRSGSLFAAPIERRDAEEFAAMRREFWKSVTVTNAKQVGLGLLSYAQDYDETFPPAENVQGLVSPYLKLDTVFLSPETGQPGFTYVRPGSGKLRDVKSPATTVIGYFSGPGGRAVLYVDGHVMWEDAP